MLSDALRRRSLTFLAKGTTERQNKEVSGCHARFVLRDLSHRHLGLLHSWAASYTLPALPTPLVSPRANRRPSRRSSPSTAGHCRRTCGGVWRARPTSRRWCRREMTEFLATGEVACLPRRYGRR